MSKFFVGQRVRVKWCNGMPELGGREARILGPLTDFIDAVTWEERQGYPVDLHPHFYPAPDQLEPILPSGAAPSELTFTELMDRCRAGEVEA